jgi:hypothetical protein
MESDGDHFLTGYLTKDNQSTEHFKESRADPRDIESLQKEEEVRPYPPPSPVAADTNSDVGVFPIDREVSSTM